MKGRKEKELVIEVYRELLRRLKDEGQKVKESHRKVGGQGNKKLRKD